MNHQRRVEAISLYSQGYTLQQVADQLKVAKSTAHRWVNEDPNIVRSGYNSRNRVYTEETRRKLSAAATKGNRERWLNGLCKKKPYCEMKSASHVRARLFKDRGRRCEECGWDKKNPFNNQVPVQVHHIDGNRANTCEDNLKILCPNCHAMTEKFMFYGASHNNEYGKKGVERYR